MLYFSHKYRIDTNSYTTRLIRTSLLYILMLIMLHNIDIYSVWYTT
jgi:hypothetical protein